MIKVQKPLNDTAVFRIDGISNFTASCCLAELEDKLLEKTGTKCISARGQREDGALSNTSTGPGLDFVHNNQD